MLRKALSSPGARRAVETNRGRRAASTVRGLDRRTVEAAQRPRFVLIARRASSEDTTLRSKACRHRDSQESVTKCFRTFKIIRSFVFDSLFDNRWDNDLRVRRISLTADAPSFKVKVPRTSRAGVNETLTGEQVAARLVSVMRSRAHRGKTMDEWRKEQLAWLLDPVRPAKKG